MIDHRLFAAAPTFLGAGWTPNPGEEPAVGRWISLIAASGILVGAIPAAYFVSRSSAAHKEQSPVIVTSASADPVEGCTTTVMGLLARMFQAVQNGYSSGLNLDEVAVQYGTESPVFHAFSYLQADLIGRVVTHRADGQLTAIQPQVRQECRDWMGSTS